MILLSHLSLIFQHAHTATLARFVEPLHDAMQEFGIQTPLREAAFLAQIGHESGELQFLHELASGDHYEGRKDLGNLQQGDGVRFKGRGLLQVTGRSNYAAVGAALGLDLLGHPELLEVPVNACRSAGYFWEKHGLNPLADVGAFEQITHRINGGLTHQKERMAYYERAKHVLGIKDEPKTDSEAA